MGGQAGGWRVIGPRRPDDRGGGHVDVPCVRTHGGRAGWVARCTGTQATCTHSNQIGHSRQISQPKPRAPHPSPRTLYPVSYALPMHPAPRTPHPTPSTLYPIGFRGPRTLDTTTRLCGEGEGHSNGNLFLLLFFPGTPPLFFPPTGSRFPLAFLYYKNKNRCFPTQFSPPHRNMLYALLVHGPQETQFLGLSNSQGFQVFFKMYQATHFQDIFFCIPEYRSCVCAPPPCTVVMAVAKSWITGPLATSCRF